MAPFKTKRCQNLFNSRDQEFYPLIRYFQREGIDYGAPLDESEHLTDSLGQ